MLFFIFVKYRKESLLEQYCLLAFQVFIIPLFGQPNLNRSESHIIRSLYFFPVLVGFVIGKAVSSFLCLSPAHDVRALDLLFPGHAS